jgi:hypothetical protein
LCDPALLHQIAVRAIRSAARAVDFGRAERPERRVRSPGADRGIGDESGRGILRGQSENVGEIDRTGTDVQRELVHLEIAEPARCQTAVRTEHAHVDLIQLRATHVHADRKRRRREHAIHALHLGEDLFQGIDDRTQVGTCEVFALALVGHALHQGDLRLHRIQLDLARIVDRDREHRRRLPIGKHRIDVVVGHEPRVFVRPVGLLPRGRQSYGIGPQAATEASEQGFSRVVLSVVARAVADEDDEVLLAAVADRAHVRRARRRTAEGRVIALDLSGAGKRRLAAEVQICLMHRARVLCVASLVSGGSGFCETADEIRQCALVSRGSVGHLTNVIARISAANVRVAAAGLGEHHESDIELVAQSGDHRGQGLLLQLVRGLTGHCLGPVRRVIPDDQHVGSLCRDGGVRQEDVGIVVHLTEDLRRRERSEQACEQ